MVSLFFSGVEQDFKIFLLAPVVCAIFRTIFIAVYRPETSIARDAARLWQCYRYAFWWGMDFNAYVFLISMVAVSLPGAFLPEWYQSGDTIRAIGVTVYLLLLYVAFVGKMIYFGHYHDTYNHLMWLGRNADKKNLLDIFFNQDHGALLLLSLLPAGVAFWWMARSVLEVPSFDCPVFEGWWQYAFGMVFFLGCIAFFYFFRFGGTFLHRNKPEWDEVPLSVKSDAVLGKATVDDFIALEIVWKHPLNEYMSHSDEVAKEAVKRLVPPEKWQSCQADRPWQVFERRAAGALITPPKHIFFIIVESFSAAAFDEAYAGLRLADDLKGLFSGEDSFCMKNFLPAGIISQPSLISMLSGIYDTGLELNEMRPFWDKTLGTALPVQFNQLGYRTEFWYGGGLNWASLQHYLPGAGFDRIYGGTDICPGAPRTWLGVYDHIFLSRAAELIKAQDDAPALHVLYTTSNHGPYRIPVENYGFDFSCYDERVQKRAADDNLIKRKIGCCQYALKAVADFISEMKAIWPDSLFVVTGDHAMGDFPFDCGLLPDCQPGIRERMGTMLLFSHSQLRTEMFAGNIIGTHLNIGPTLIELIAPKGYKYCSLLEPLTYRQNLAVTPQHWLTEKEIGSFSDNCSEPLVAEEKAVEGRNGIIPAATEIRDGLCEFSGYIARHPEVLLPKECLQ